MNKFEELPSRKSVKKAIKAQRVYIDGQVGHTGDWIQSGMKIQLVAHYDNRKIFKIPIEVVFEDEFLAIVNKPAGLVTSGNQFRTLENTLAFNLNRHAHYPLSPVHRLDKATCGLVLIAKTPKVKMALNRMFEKRSIEKTYGAIILGLPVLPQSNIQDKIQNKPAYTHYKFELSSKDKTYSYLTLTPQTGRTHQLRIHCANIGHPIVGDPLYGNPKAGPQKGLFLCAHTLSFQHPITNQWIKTGIELPKKFNRFFQQKHFS